MKAFGIFVSLLLGAANAHAFGETDRFAFGQIQYGGNWNPRPTATQRLTWEIDKRTSIDVLAQAVPVRLADEQALRRFPFLYLAGDAAMPAPTDGEIANLRRHLQAGGFLLIDNAEGRPEGAFDQSVRALLKRVFPQKRIEQLSSEHVVYKSFYLLHTPVGRIAQAPYLEAVLHDGRAVVLYSQNDLGGAWARDNFGQWEHEVFPGGERQREMAFRLGVNIAMYALCLDYKTDQVHVPFLLRRRQWQSR